MMAGLAPAHPIVGVSTAVHSATVWVSPPLFANPAGSSRGSVSQIEVPIVFVHPAPAKPHESLSSRLCPPSVMVAIVAEQLVEVPETMVLVVVSEPPSV